MTGPAPNGIVTLLTDFGIVDPYAAVMKGAVLRVHPRAVLVDVTHDVPPQDVEVGAFFVAACVDRFPAGTVHVAVVDPGVGTGRRLLAVEAGGAWWVGPDNGLLGAALALAGAGVIAVDAAGLGLQPASRTFHGRDLFAPIAGMLASGARAFADLGPRIGDPVRLPSDAAPRVLFADRFGNLITNVDGADVVPGRSRVRIARRDVPCVGTYGEATRGALVALVNSYGTLEIAVVDGSARDLLGVGRGDPVELVDGVG